MDHDEPKASDFDDIPFLYMGWYTEGYKEWVHGMLLRHEQYVHDKLLTPKYSRALREYRKRQPRIHRRLRAYYTAQYLWEIIAMEGSTKLLARLKLAYHCSHPDLQQRRE